MRFKTATLAIALTFAVVPTSATLASQPSIAAEQVEALARSLKPQQGKVTLPEAKATLDLGKAYDFYGPADARTILVQMWGNPPDAANEVLGLVLPAGVSPLTDTWGAVVTYEDTGHVSDEDAAEVDYADLMSQMQEGQGAENEQRKAAGYPEIQLVGWAQQPVYDKASHSVVWARNLKFSDAPANTLNYDVRTLGRGGVLSLNLISSMAKLPEVRKAATDFAAHASFDPGARYADFDPSTDRSAEYGIGGLVAAGAGVAVAKKLGIFAILLKFLKPILIGLVAMFAVFRNKIMGLFGSRRDPLEGDQDQG